MTNLMNMSLRNQEIVREKRMYQLREREKGFYQLVMM
jgi:hypothetical protein